jgi:glycosyltransferase involved in cell wall biosynthesis
MISDIPQAVAGTVDFTPIDSVLLVTPRWTRDGGVGAHVEASAHALAQHGLRVEVLAARVDDADQPADVNIVHQPALFNSDASMEARVKPALDSNPAVVHLHQVDDPQLVDFLREHAPVVISAHAYTACPSGVYYFQPGHECARARGPGCIPNMLLRGCAHTRDPRELPAKYERAGRRLRALARADLAVAYSSSVDRHLAANGLTRRALIPLFTTTAARTGSGHDSRRRVVFAGRIVRPKGVDVLIRAAREVEGEFVICGDGRQLGAMRELARACGVEDRVHYRGWLSAEDLAEELAQASVAVIPSLWPEPFGLVGIEALAAGRPVVASATGGVSDWLQDGVSGTLVPPGDESALAWALNDLLESPERQQTMGAAGKRTVESRFSRERHVAELMRAYATARASWASR